MQIAYSKTRMQFPLSYKKIIKKTITSALLVILPLFIILGYLSLINKGEVSWLGTVIFISLIIAFIAILLIYLYQRWYFAVYFYDLTPDFIRIRKGPITPREVNIPYDRVQDVYVDQDLLDRIFGLYDVHLSSATISSGMEAHIDGLEKKDADGLRDVILQKVQQKISKNKATNISTGEHSIG